MVEAYLRRSALAHLSLPARAEGDKEHRGAAGVWLAERPHRAQVNLRGNAADPSFLAAVRGAVGVELPTTPNRTSAAGEAKALWLGPDEWLLVGPGGRQAEWVSALRRALDGQHAAVIDWSEARTAIAISGPKARDLMAKGTPLDLHPRAFAPGQCAQSVFAKTTMILDQIDDGPTYELYVLNSFADYLWAWLTRAGEEYGIAAVE
jgi:sarcosine oxidase subunit gamma